MVIFRISTSWETQRGLKAIDGKKKKKEEIITMTSYACECNYVEQSFPQSSQKFISHVLSAPQGCAGWKGVPSLLPIVENCNIRICSMEK